MKVPLLRRIALAATIVVGSATLVSAPAGADTDGPKLPDMPVNACHDASLPRSYGTNFPAPRDPHGFGYANQSVIGWQGNVYAPFSYLSGSYFARGVPNTYRQGGRSYCGQMYSFGVYTYGLTDGQPPKAGSVHWHMASGYLPALTTSFTRDDVAISITDFADRQSIGGRPVELVYTRISVTNHGSAAADVPPQPSGAGLVALNDDSDTVAPGATAVHDYVAAVDTFSTEGTLPSTRATKSAARPYPAAYRHMAGYWRHRLRVIPRLSLPNVSLPHTNGLEDPGTRLDQAYKAAFVYTRIVQTGDAPFSAANNYDWLLDHDIPGMLANRFALGDLADARNLLLVGRISTEPGFDEVGANWYWDGPWRTPVAWAKYLQMTGDTGFIKKYFHDDADGSSPYGPSLYTLMHTDYLSQLDNDTGYLKPSSDNDSGGTWLFDDETALAGLSAYSYLASRIGEAAEATWSQHAYHDLLTATNKALRANESAGDFDFLPCEVDKPVTDDRCSNPKDANWAGSNLWGQNVWTILLNGGRLSGVLADPAQTDNLYRTGFSRLAGTGVPYPSFGAYSGYSVALNTGYAAGALYGDAYRDLPITSYAWQLATTTGGPNAWWEANGSAPDPDNPWAGSHAGPQFGAVPYAWPMAGQTQTLLQSLVARGLVTHVDAGGSPDFHTVLYVGRGVPDAWLVPGQSIAVDNLTASDDVAGGGRATYGVHLAVTSHHGHRRVRVTFTGRVPTHDVRIQLPSLATAGVRSVHGGTYDAATHTVTTTGNRTVHIELGRSAAPKLQQRVQSTVPGTHTQPILISGKPTTVSATITGAGATTAGNVRMALRAPNGWSVKATTPTRFADLAPGESKSVTWRVTPADDATGAHGLTVSGSYTAPDQASGSVRAETWVHAQRPLPVPPGSTDLALSATPTASYTSPWEHVTAINDGIYPPSSNDNANPRWGTWPRTGAQWIELDWTKPISTDGGALYFLDDGGGVRLPASWKVQYWNGDAFVDLPAAGGYPVADDTFNRVAHAPVTTTRLRAVLTSGQGSVGALEWVVDSTPDGSTG